MLGGEAKLASWATIMKINIISIKSKKEDKYIKPFVEFYLSEYAPNIKSVDIECPDENNRQTFPDYFVVQPKILVEVKEVHDEKESKVSADWSHNIERLKNELKKWDLKGVNGSFLVNTPLLLRVKKGKESNVINQILNAIHNNQKIISITGVGDFEIQKFSDREHAIRFGLTGPFKFINPSSTIHQNIGPKIKTANIQLGSFKKYKARKRILLLSNRYDFGDEISEFIEALSLSYKELLNYRNIDEIWLQMNLHDGTFLHDLIYKLDFLSKFDKQMLKPDSQTIALFEKWFSPLSKLGDDYKEKLFNALKSLLENKEPYHVFGDKFVREEMAELGIWLADKDRFDDAIWIIDKFIDDPDPEEPAKYSGDPRFNYHQQILNGEDPRIITTVLGRLAWVVQKLALREDYIIQAFEHTKKLLKHKNLYVNFQAITPLIEIAVRRPWLEGYDEQHNTKKYQEFCNVVFGLLKNYAKYQAIAKWLTHVFDYFKDLTTAEALEVLEKLKITDESALLFIYFGIFRERHYKNPDGTDKKGFDPAPLKTKLEEIIRDNDDKYTNLRSNITWQFWEFLDKNPNEFNTIKPYIDLFLKQPYCRNVYHAIDKIIEEWVDKKPEICISWFEQIISNILEFVKENSDEARNVWLTTEKIVEVVAREKSDRLLDLMENLIDLWKIGVYIGSPKKLFESYKLIDTQKVRIEVKKKFEMWYESLRKLNPKIEVVDWN